MYEVWIKSGKCSTNPGRHGNCLRFMVQGMCPWPIQQGSLQGSNSCYGDNGLNEKQIGMNSFGIRGRLLGGGGVNGF